ncbi:hypothetical protein LTR95_008740 [Oleoguttula sp. CCFEE 5521]
MQLLKLLALAGLANAAVLPTSPNPPAAISERAALPAGVSLSCAHDLPSSKYLMAQNLNNFLLAHSGSVIHANNFVSDTYFLPQHNVDLILRNTCGKDAVPTFDEAYKNFQRILSCTADGTSYGGAITVTGWCFKAEYNVTPKTSPLSPRNDTYHVNAKYDDSKYTTCAPGSRMGDHKRFLNAVGDFCFWANQNGVEAHKTRSKTYTEGSVETTISLRNSYNYFVDVNRLGCVRFLDDIDKCDSGMGAFDIDNDHYTVSKKSVKAKRDLTFELIPIAAGNDTVITQDTPPLIQSVTHTLYESRHIRVYCILGSYMTALSLPHITTFSAPASRTTRPNRYMLTTLPSRNTPWRLS